jgi:hypothetical protein
MNRCRVAEDIRRIEVTVRLPSNVKKRSNASTNTKNPIPHVAEQSRDNHPPCFLPSMAEAAPKTKFWRNK